VPHPHSSAGCTVVPPLDRSCPPATRACRGPAAVPQHIHRSLHREAKGAHLYKAANLVRCARRTPATHRVPSAPLPPPEPSSIIRLQPQLPNRLNTSTWTHRSSSRRTLPGIASLSPDLRPAAVAGPSTAEPPRQSPLFPNSGRNPSSGELLNLPCRSPTRHLRELARIWPEPPSAEPKGYITSN
jgi:hypothetical protein